MVAIMGVLTKITLQDKIKMNYKVSLTIIIISSVISYFLLRSAPLSDEELTEHLTDKVVLLCGASSGIGEELAYQFAAHGAKLVLVARRQAKLEQVRTEILERGTPAENVMIISFDFSNVARSKEVIDQTLDKFGGLDYLVSNHGIVDLSGPFLAQPHNQDYIEKMFRVNLFSHIELAVHALPHIEKRDGHMFFTSSMNGELPWYRSASYASTKHAMNGFFYSLQQELRARESNVSLTIGAVGWVLTKETAQLLAENGLENPYPERQTGKVEDCARAMMEAYVTRPETMTYPNLVGRIYRAQWYFNPYFHDLAINNAKPKGSVGTGYKEAVEQSMLIAKSQHQQGHGKQ